MGWGCHDSVEFWGNPSPRAWAAEVDSDQDDCGDGERSGFDYEPDFEPSSVASPTLPAANTLEFAAGQAGNQSARVDSCQSDCVQAAVWQRAQHRMLRQADSADVAESMMPMQVRTCSAPNTELYLRFEASAEALQAASDMASDTKCPFDYEHQLETAHLRGVAHHESTPERSEWMIGLGLQ